MNKMDSIKNQIKVFARSEWIYWYYGKIRSNMQRYINDTFEANQIIENLWLGAIQSSCNREELEKRNIDTIVSAILGASATFPYDFKYERAKLRDVEDENIVDEIRRLLPEIHKSICLQKGVLVHCIWGKSRSTTIVAAYLMKYRSMSVDEALKFIKEKRSQIDPNSGYIDQLREYERELIKERDNKKNI